jgi:hypothetical protein
VVQLAHAGGAHVAPIQRSNHHPVRSSSRRVGSWRRTHLDRLCVSFVCRVCRRVDRPTWFMSRKTFDKVGGYDETFPGCPEDLIFFYAHLGLGGGLHKVDKVHRYRHPSPTHRPSRVHFTAPRSHHQPTSSLVPCVAADRNCWCIAITRSRRARPSTDSFS